MIKHAQYVTTTRPSRLSLTHIVVATHKSTRNALPDIAKLHLEPSTTSYSERRPERDVPHINCNDQIPNTALQHSILRYKFRGSHPMRVPKEERAIGCVFECEEGSHGCQIY